jgi:hypothetical protein
VTESNARCGRQQSFDEADVAGCDWDEVQLKVGELLLARERSCVSAPCDGGVSRGCRIREFIVVTERVEELVVFVHTVFPQGTTQYANIEYFALFITYILRYFYCLLKKLYCY